jgi:hypothetical protein
VGLLATESMYGVGINVRGGEAGLFIVKVRRRSGYSPHICGGDGASDAGNEREWSASNALHNAYFTSCNLLVMWGSDGGTKSFAERIDGTASLYTRERLGQIMAGRTAV